MRQKEGSNQSNTSLFLHLLVFLVLLSCFARLCCFEEKSNRISLTRQDLTLFYVSHQVFMQTSGTAHCGIGGGIGPGLNPEIIMMS
jgi:hypothetical protein